MQWSLFYGSLNVYTFFDSFGIQSSIIMNLSVEFTVQGEQQNI